jgi:hypothetical protein
MARLVRALRSCERRESDVKEVVDGAARRDEERDGSEMAM